MKINQVVQPALFGETFVFSGKYKISQWCGWVFSFAIFFSLYIYYLHLTSPLVPYMDSVRYIGQINDLLTGDASLSDIWHQSGSVGIMYQLVTLFEWTFWGLDSRLTVIFTALVWAVLFSIYAKAWPNFNDKHMSIELNNSMLGRLLVIQLLIGFYFFSPAGWEIWLLDLGFAQTLKNLIIAAYLYALSRIDYQICSIGKLFLLGVLGALIVLFVSYHWSYSFTVSAVFLVILCGPATSKVLSRGVIVIFPILLAQCIHVREAGGSLNSMAVTPDLEGFVKFMMALMYGASSIFVGGEVLDVLRIPTVILMAIGGVFIFTILVVFKLWVKNASTSRNGIFFSALGFFGFCILASIAAARGGQGYQFAASSRYFMDYQFIFIGFLGIATCLLSLHTDNDKVNFGGVRINNKSFVGGVVIVFGALAMVGHGATYLVEYKKAPYRAAVYKEQSLVYLSGVVNEKNTKLLQTDTPSLAKALAITDQYNLASLRNFSGECNLYDAMTSGDVYDLDAAGRWLGRSGLLILGRCPETFRVEGFLPKNVSARTLTVIVNNLEYKSILIPGERFALIVKQKVARNLVRLKFSFDHTHTPSESGFSDARELGAFITSIGI
jgi:hypothetical protein